MSNSEKLNKLALELYPIKPAPSLIDNEYTTDVNAAAREAFIKGFEKGWDLYREQFGITGQDVWDLKGFIDEAVHENWDQETSCAYIGTIALKKLRKRKKELWVQKDTEHLK